MKKFILSFLLALLLYPSLLSAETSAPKDSIFKAEVIKILEQKQNTLPDGSTVEQQNLLLLGLEGEYKSKQISHIGINDFEVISSALYSPGDKVLVVANPDADGNVNFYITDFVRTDKILFLFLLFIFVTVVVGKTKGLRSLASLFITFLVIISFIIPQIIKGSNPVLITMVGSFVILLAIIYITEGLKPKSHLAVISILFSLLITVILSYLFVNLAKLTGLISEDVFFLVNIGEADINFKGLLLAGIIIGALGVLDDVVISQISTVEELTKANQYLSPKEIYKRAYSVGVSHISSMTNTLFLAYAGASMSLLIIFISGQSAFNSWIQIINNEQIATEIVRALAGSIGLILSVPISTYFAVIWFNKLSKK